MASGASTFQSEQGQFPRAEVDKPKMHRAAGRTQAAHPDQLPLENASCATCAINGIRIVASTPGNCISPRGTGGPL